MVCRMIAKQIAQSAKPFLACATSAMWAEVQLSGRIRLTRLLFLLPVFRSDKPLYLANYPYSCAAPSNPHPQQAFLRPHISRTCLRDLISSNLQAIARLQIHPESRRLPEIPRKTPRPSLTTSAPRATTMPTAASLAHLSRNSVLSHLSSPQRDGLPARAEMLYSVHF